jgi:hypothetical protein
LGPDDITRLEVVVLFLVVVTVVLLFAYTLVTGISPMPTSPRVKRAMLASLPAHLDGPIFELGAGWGTLAFALAGRYPSCRVEAYELSPVPWLFMLARKVLWRVPNLAIHRTNFLEVDLAPAALVTCYLYPGGMERLRPVLEAALRPGAIVLSNCFAMPGWTPTATRIADDLYASTVYTYVIPPGAAPGATR